MTGGTVVVHLYDHGVPLYVGLLVWCVTVVMAWVWVVPAFVLLAIGAILLGTQLRYDHQDRPQSGRVPNDQ